MKPQTNENWEKEFDKLEVFSAETKTKGDWTFTVDISDVKSFIRHLLSQSQIQAEKQGYEQGLNEGLTLREFSETVIRQEERPKCQKEKIEIFGNIIIMLEEEFTKEEIINYLKNRQREIEKLSH